MSASLFGLIVVAALMLVPISIYVRAYIRWREVDRKRRAEREAIRATFPRSRS